jgi:alanyl-tRNA synthetase
LVTEADEGAVIRAVFTDRDVEFAKKVAAKIAGFGRAAVIGVTNGTGGAVAMARSIGSSVNCGAILREVFSTFGARGGGPAEMAQGVCEGGQVQELVNVLVGRL